MHHRAQLDSAQKDQSLALPDPSEVEREVNSTERNSRLTAAVSFLRCARKNLLLFGIKKELHLVSGEAED